MQQMEFKTRIRIEKRSNQREVIALTQYSADNIAKSGKLIAKRVIETPRTIENPSKLREIVDPTLSLTKIWIELNRKTHYRNSNQNWKQINVVEKAATTQTAWKRNRQEHRKTGFRNSSSAQKCNAVDAKRKSLQHQSHGKLFERKKWENRQLYVFQTRTVFKSSQTSKKARYSLSHKLKPENERNVKNQKLSNVW